MAESVKKIDVLKESWLLQSYQDRQRNRAQRGGVVDGLPGTTPDDDVEAANNLFLTTPAYQTHPQDTSLPLLAVRSASLRPTVATSTLVYGHGPFSTPTQDAFAMCDERRIGSYLFSVPQRRTSESNATIIDVDVATGDTVEVQTSLFAGIKRYRMPLKQITVRTVLTEHPDVDTAGLYTAINDDYVMINGVQREPGSLQYQGADVRAFDANGTVKHLVFYVFFWTPKGFTRLVTQMWGSYEADAAASYSDRFTRIIDAPGNNPVVDFTDAFPTHDGTGPASGSATGSWDGEPLAL